MLLELSISDFAIIDRTTLRFSEGLNVLTGETGSGKSILLDALGAVLGTRVSSDLVRTGRPSASIEAAFSLEDDEIARVQDICDEAGIADFDQGTLILTRDILASGRSTARVNGRLTTAGTLTQLGSLLVDIHGQSDHLAILRPAEQLNLLDRYAATVELRAEFARTARTWRDIRRQRTDLATSERERSQRVDLLRFQVDEIEATALTEEEDEALVREREILRNADRLRTDAQEIHSLLAGQDVDDTGVVSALRRVTNLMADMAGFDKGMAAALERANELLVLADDLAHEARDYAESTESDELRLQEVDDRIDAINTLKRKYGATIGAIQAYGREAMAELSRLTSGAFDDAVLEEDEERHARTLASVGSDLSTRRSGAAVDLSRRIEEAIAHLNMGRTQVEISVNQRGDPSGIPFGRDRETVKVEETGLDQVEFLIAPNAGESLKPLARVASGGETARLMLAIKSILSQVDLTPTLVFDEIDVGVGGRSGQVVGEKLRSIAESHQVIVVTHLPQIAAFAETHLRIEKEDFEGRTVSTVRGLDMEERITELAAMLDGTPVSDASIRNASEMLERSRRSWERAARSGA